ncbi:MAG: cell wall hydrolase [Dokdonella sp.]|uniref:cell wall hydrolase n=1 Tax=Dokdonella sp. TaxID=2291710 RepID=UPI0025C5984C|nr:cell wall hydrolase [Dokdonella sp.]MBX3700884.1 cell wall hydrolase [Dokdonella sp.]
MTISFLLWLATILPQPAADQVCLATTVYLEARSESQVGQMAVAEVAMRRREHGRWGNTVCDVVRAPGQFALTTTNPRYALRNPRAWAAAWAVAGHAIHMWSLPIDRRRLVVPDADHFVLAESTTPAWIKGAAATTIGAHNFYHIN